MAEPAESIAVIDGIEVAWFEDQRRPDGLVDHIFEGGTDEDGEEVMRFVLAATPEDAVAKFREW